MVAVLLVEVTLIFDVPILIVAARVLIVDADVLIVDVAVLIVEVVVGARFEPPNGDDTLPALGVDGRFAPCPGPSSSSSAARPPYCPRPVDCSL